jgi:site-specific DNA-methyltransferase (adenine-specific)
MAAITILHGQAQEVLAEFSNASVDTMVTDPPAGISFMGKDWDHDHGGRAGWCAAFTAVFSECLRTLKPGAYALVWALPRTSHWTATALEDAGFEIRDVLTHHFGTGFPKSLNVGKMLDEWKGWGTALKPATEHWILCRKPLAGTVAANVAEHRAGALNVDGCRVEGGLKRDPRSADGTRSQRVQNEGWDRPWKQGEQRLEDWDAAQGRWPPNLLLTHAADCGDECADGCPVREMDAQSGEGHSGQGGGASRFFPRFRYQAKPSQRERNAGLPEGEKNKHPTVKSVELMRWLCRLVTPPGGVVLDPFMGSGSTGVACAAEGFRFIGIEGEAEYVQLAEQRIAAGG